MRSEPVHLSLGSCRYAAYKPGNLVELSQSGWGAGLAVNYAYTFGRVVKFEAGILTVIREGVDRPQEYHPCFWIKCRKKDIKALRKMEYKEYWLDHVPDPSDDLQVEFRDGDSKI